MQRTQPRRVLRSTIAGDGEVSPDRGCQFWARCVSCPWRLCLREELPGAEQARVRAAVMQLRSYLLPIAAEG